MERINTYIVWREQELFKKRLDELHKAIIATEEKQSAAWKEYEAVENKVCDEPLTEEEERIYDNYEKLCAEHKELEEQHEAVENIVSLLGKLEEELDFLGIN